MSRHFISVQSGTPPAPFELNTGDLVWMVDIANPRGYYPLVLKLRYGADAIAQSAEVRKSGIFNRPVVKLVPVLHPTSSLGLEDVACSE